MTAGWRLVRRDTGAVVVEHLELAAGFWSHFVGLQFRAALAAGAGLLLVPCSSIHTFFVRFLIDVVMIDRTGRVIGVARTVLPWRVVSALRGTHAILELPAGSGDVAPGVGLRLEGASAQAGRPPSRAVFLM